MRLIRRSWSSLLILSACSGHPGASDLGDGTGGELSGAGGDAAGTGASSALGGAPGAGGAETGAGDDWPSSGGAPASGGATSSAGAPSGAGGTAATGGAGGGQPSGGASSGGTHGGEAGGSSAGGGAPREVLSFPGAEGFGRYARGGRGGDVAHVTNLNDSGPGSLREAISQPNRTVVFEVSGVIRLESRLVFRENQTIAGQTAPGGGVIVYGDGTSFTNAHHAIVRYMRFRMGRGGESGKDTVTIARGHDMIFDHCSLSWGRDGNFDLNQESGYELKNITLQDSIVAQGLQTHSTGGLLNAQGVSVLRSLYIDNNSRNPKARMTTQWVNNVVYNWVVSGYILGDTQGRSDGYMVGTYFITGPETKGGTLDSPTPSYHIYARGNYYDDNKNGALDGRPLGQGDFGTATWKAVPSVSFPEVREMSAEEAFEYVLAHAGASLVRDAADEYVIDEVRSLGKKGATIANESELGLSGGVGAVPGGTPPVDVDRDGMADAWELERGLSPNDPEDRNGDRDGDGYTNLEEYLNWLVER